MTNCRKRLGSKEVSLLRPSQFTHHVLEKDANEHWREKEHLFRKRGSEPKLKPTNLLLQWWSNDNYILSFQVGYMYTHTHIYIYIHLSFQVVVIPTLSLAMACFHASSPSTNPLLSSSSSPCSLGKIALWYWTSNFSDPFSVDSFSSGFF